MLRSATSLKQTAVSDVSSLKVAFDGRASRLRSFVEKQKSIVDGLHPKFDAEDMVRFAQCKKTHPQKVVQRFR